MKIRILCILIIALTVNILFSADAAALQVSANSAVLMCADSGQILYAVNEHKQMSMASTTKIMTALLAIENLSMEATIKAGNEVLNVDGTALGLKPGDDLTVYDLLIGLMLSSGNDAANAVAVAVSGSIDAFVLLMNERAAQIGMTDTSFATPSGLDDEKHYSTAYDMALLTRTALMNDVFVDIVSRYTATIYISGRKIWLRNHNRLLQSYDGMIGVKTGFTKKSGRCLVTAAQRDGKCLIAVTLHAPDDWQDHRIMLDYGYSVIREYTIDTQNQNYYIDIVGGEIDKISCSPAAVPTYVSDSQLGDISFSVSVAPFIYAPVTVGDIVGELNCIYDGKTIATVALCADSDVESIVIPIEQESKWDRFLQLLNGWFSYG